MVPRPIELSIVVPAFNEEANLAPVIRRTVEALEAAFAPGGCEIVIVNDGSRDGTGRVADELARLLPQIQVVHHASNQGFGAALRSGYLRAGGQFCVAIPADGEVGIEEALSLFAAKGDADVMVSRRVRSVSTGREVLTKGWHVLMTLLAGADLRGRDGIYVIRTSLVQQMRLHSSTGLVNLEILMLCHQRGARIHEGVMHASPRLSGESKVTNVRTVVKVLWEMVKLRFVRSWRS